MLAPGLLREDHGSLTVVIYGQRDVSIGQCGEVEAEEVRIWAGHSAPEGVQDCLTP